MKTSIMNQTRFAHIWGYGLLVLWCSVSFIIFATQIPSTWPNIFAALSTTIFLMFSVGIIAIPLSGLVTLGIGGVAWLILKRVSLPNSLRASIAGGLSGAMTGLPFLIADLRNGQSQIIYLILGLGALGLWSGWLGERLARRHVKIDRTAIADSFD